MLDRIVKDFWIWGILLIIGVYFVGFTTEAQTVLPLIGNLIDIGTGRDPKTGQFANYPGQN